MAITVMSGAARALVMDLEARGIDPTPFLGAAALTRAAVFDPDRRLPVGAVDRLWQAAGTAVGDPLEAAARLPLGAYRVLDFVAAHSETVGSGLQRIAAYFPLVDPRVRMRVETDLIDDDGRGIATLSMTMRDGSPTPVMAQRYTFAAIVHRFRQFCGVHWPLLRVEFAGDDVPDVARHAAFFGSEIRMRQRRPMIVVTSETFAMALPARERELLPLLDQHARLQMAALGLKDEPVEGLAEAVRLACAEGRPSLPSVARRLGVPARTLQRRLEEAGTWHRRCERTHGLREIVPAASAGTRPPAEGA